MITRRDGQMTLKKYDIITMGSATIDIFVDTGSDLFRRGKQKGIVEVPFGSKITTKEVHFDVGGGGTNSAIAFSRMGFKTAFIGKIGNDANGKHVLSNLRKNKVDSYLVVESGDATGFSVVLDADGHDRTIIVYRGTNDKLKPSEVRVSKIKTEWFYLATMMGDSFKSLEKVAEFAKRKGIKVMFNPSSYLAKKGLGYLKKILDATDILVLNDKEASLLSKKNGLQVMAQTLYEKCKCIVVITLGSKGALAFNGNRMYTIKSNKIKVLETTGAGDAFASGFLAGYIKSDDIDFALKIGRAQSESVITHYGSKNKLLGWRALNKLIGK